MQIRPMQLHDLDRLADLDATIESAEYLHLGQADTPAPITWTLEPRPLRTKLIESNPPGDELRFTLKQIVTGIEEGSVLVAEHQEQVVGLAAAQPRAETNLLSLLDLRVDYDLRRQGVASAMLFQIIQQARAAGMRAIRAETKTNNHPINALLGKLGFDLSGVDTRHDSNHDLVKESVTLFWYLSFD